VAKWQAADLPQQSALHYIAVTAQGTWDNMYRMRMPFKQIGTYGQNPLMLWFFRYPSGAQC
jgi:hypothetical protein